MARGAGAGGGVRPPSYPAYYVALGGVLLLLLLLCCYVLYYCITKINELSKCESLISAPPGPARPAGYPVQPAVRSGAAALAKLCQHGSPSATPSEPGQGQHAPTLDTQSCARSEPTLSTEVSDAGPTLEPSNASPPSSEVR